MRNYMKEVRHYDVYIKKKCFIINGIRVRTRNTMRDNWSLWVSEKEEKDMKFKSKDIWKAYTRSRYITYRCKTDLIAELFYNRWCTSSEDTLKVYHRKTLVFEGKVDDWKSDHYYKHMKRY